ncbi:hypothetical protein RHGRI_008579 [Rhododendron griersonianum]|uniref:DNA-directed primase/polymerase protein n=1 Tax=Rhododendron griersonianum TaxID=479676 RepID=A0AAV6L327_9ERIC|nr:hypothetical protein RHGRI_008579 [Rhododendron griersonianum]
MVSCVLSLLFGTTLSMLAILLLANSYSTSTCFVHFRKKTISRAYANLIRVQVCSVCACRDCFINSPAKRQKKREREVDKRCQESKPEWHVPHMLFLQHIENSQKDYAGDQGNPNIKQDSRNHPLKHHFWPIFYHEPQMLQMRRLSSSLLYITQKIRINFGYQPNFSYREDIWATFPRQDEAMKYAKEHPHVRVFSYQDHMNGQRRFLVSTYEEFWRRYKNMNPRFRHHYEVIQEGLPCHLYFDLEFNKRDNTEKDGDEMVDLLITVVFDALSDKYGIQGDHDWIVELDSSTEAKFSRHLIIRLQKTAFKDNSHAGAFIAEICSRINNEKGSDRRFEKLFVSKDSSSADIPSQIFVDTAVYSRNRCFRLPLSSKAGKNSVLLPTGQFKCKNMSEENVFMASLICNMDADCEKLLICKMDSDCVKALQFDTEINSEFQKQSSASHEFMLNSCTSDLSRTYLIGKSPFPTLDVFVESIATIGNVSGKIRSWYWFSEYGMMVYSMSRNRYCERIGREHKSNHVIYIVDLRKAVYYQKCHDPDCRGYRSPSRPIHKDAIPDDTILFNFGLHNIGGSADENLEHQLVQNGQEHMKFYSDESITDSCRKDGWWIEAIRAAEKIENMPRTLDLTETDEMHSGDEDWWMAVEKTLSQAELTYIL